MQTHRRMILTLPLLAAAHALPALAQSSYPDKPITVIVPQGPGGANDAIARVITRKLSELLNQSILVDNRPGAGGNIGTAYAAKARPDGYTLMLTTNSAQVINPALYKSTGFDPVKDFTPVATVATAGYVLVAHTSFPPNNVRELIAYAKQAQPDSISYASSGNGTLNHLVVEMLKKQAGIQLVHVPYRSSAAAATDVASGQVPLSAQSLPSSLGFIRGGKLKVIGVVNGERVATLPDVPTIGETLPGFGATPWYGLFAPANTPTAVVSRLQVAVAQTLDSGDVQEQLAIQGCEVLRSTPAEFTQLIASDLTLWARIVKESGARLD